MRVIAPPDVGGGFGTKGMYYPEYIVVAELARQLGRPVKWIETRREHTLVACVERDQVHDVEIAATRDGRLLALRDDFLHEMGAYTISGLNLPQNAMIHSVGSYVIPTLDLRFRGVMTCTTPVGAYRGAGRPYGTARHRARDGRARAGARHGPGRAAPAQPRSPPTGTRTRPASPPRGAGRWTTTAATTRAAWTWRWRRSTCPRRGREQARLRAEGRYLGIGVVNYVEATATVPNESAVVRVHPDGAVTVVSGAAPQGQGHVTMFSRLVGRLLGVEPDAIEVLTGDTALVHTGGGTYGSRTAAIGGSAALLASRAVLEKARRVAAHLLEAAPADVVVEHGTVLGARAAEPHARLARGRGGRARGAGARRGRRPRGHARVQRGAVELRQRHPRGRAGGGSGDRRGADPALDRGARLRPRARAGHRRRADPRRRGAGPARRAQRPARLRRDRPAPHRDAHGLRARHRGGRAAQLRAPPPRDRRRRSTRSAPRARARAASCRCIPSSPRPSRTRWRPSARASSACR